MSAQGYTLPATAVCPGCGRMVVLPVEPFYPGMPPSICATCETEIPDYRRPEYMPSNHLPTPGEPAGPESADEVPMEDRRFSRGGLFRSLGGLVADRGIIAVEAAKDRFNS